MKLHVFIDGASRGNPGPASTGVVLQDENGKTLKEYGRAIGIETNNVAEYTALLDALSLAAKMGADSLRVHSDSLLLVKQLKGEYRVKNARLAGYLTQIREQTAKLADFEIVHVRREFNKQADKMANIALDSAKI